MNKFELGDEVFTSDGHAASFVAKVEDQFLVKLLYNSYDDDDDEPYFSDTVITVNKVFQHPPRMVFDEQIAQAKKELQSLRSEIESHKDTLYKGKHERDALLEKLTQIPALKNIEAILDGKATHLVSTRDGALSILETRNVTRNCNDSERVLSLKGSYYDGTFKWTAPTGLYGSASDCVPCTSLDEARRVALDILNTKIVESRTSNVLGWSNYITRSCHSLGITVPQEILDRLNAEKRKSIEDDVAHAASTLEKAKAKLDALK